MRGFLATLVGAAVAFSVAVPAPAQTNSDDYTPLNSRIKRPHQYPLTNPAAWQPAQLDKVNKKRSGAMLSQFSKCVFHRNKTQALNLLEKTDFGFVDFKQVGLDNEEAARIYGFKDCMGRVADAYHTGVVLRWSAPGLRQWLVEEAYFETYPDAPSWVKPGYIIDERQYPLSANNPLVQTEMNLADCVVASDPGSADFFFRAQAGSDEEKQAEQKLIPALSPCITDGQQVELQPAALRMWIGEALWHAANHSSPAPAEAAGGSQ